MQEDLNTFEALKWLKSNNNPSAFASNRFGETANAIKFVENLYELGAANVKVTGILDEPERIEEEGGAYASTLLVETPGDTEKRKRILEVYYNEIEEHGLNEGEQFKGESESTLFFWWD